MIAAHQILVDEAASSDVAIPKLLYYSHARNKKSKNGKSEY